MNSTSVDTLHAAAAPLWHEPIEWADSALLHSTAVAPLPGYAAEPLSYRLGNDAWVMGALFAGLALSLLLWRAIHHFLALRFRLFVGLGTSSDVSSIYAARNTLEKHYGLLATLLLALAHALGLFALGQPLLQAAPMTVSSPRAMGYYYVGMLAWLTFRYTFYQFVNCIFFDKTKRRIWNDAYFLLIFAEAGLSFPLLVLLTSSSAFGPHAMRSILLLFLLARMVLSFKTYGVLFGKVHCLLHFFVYFCALEILPGAVVGTLLVRNLSSLVEIF